MMNNGIGVTFHIRDGGMVFIVPIDYNELVRLLTVRTN